MKLSKLYIVFIIVVLLLSFTSADYKFENMSGSELMHLYSNNGNLSILGNLSATNFFGDGSGLTSLNSSVLNQSVINYWSKSGSDLYYNSGNVGIGTNIPGAKLDVNDNGVNIPNVKFTKTIGGSNNIIISNTFLGGSSFGLNTGIWGIDNGGFSIRDIDNSIDRFVIQKTTGNVGIGTSTPASKLEVNGTAYFGLNSGTRISIESGGYIKTLSQLTNDNIVIRAKGTGGIFTGYGDGSGGIRVYDGGTIQGSLISGSTADSYLNKNGGNVGIGTSTPSKMLDIRNNGDATIKLAKLDGDQSLILSGGNGGTQLIQSAYNLGIDSGGSRRFTILSGGNVGIGTSSPISNLNVKGNVSIGGLSGSALTVDTSGITKWGGITKQGVLTWDTGYASVYATSGNILKLGAGGGQGVININETNVGIGTASPTEKLQVSTGNIKVDFQGNNYIGSSANNGLFFDGSGNYGMNVNSNLGLGLIFESDGGTAKSFFIGTGNKDPDSATKLLTILQNGNVGIGTTSPTSSLMVKKDTVGQQTLLTLENNGTHTIGNTASIDFNVWSSTTARIEAIAETAGAGTGLGFWTHTGGAWGERVRIDKDGNVGINTTTPQNTLNVIGDLNVTGIIYGSSGTTIVQGTGTANKLTKWSATGDSIVDSAVSDDSNAVVIEI